MNLIRSIQNIVTRARGFVPACDAHKVADIPGLYTRPHSGPVVDLTQSATVRPGELEPSKRCNVRVYFDK